MAKKNEQAIVIYTVARADKGLDEDHPYDINIILFDNDQERQEHIGKLPTTNEYEQRRFFEIDPKAARTLDKAYSRLWDSIDLTGSDSVELDSVLDKAWINVLRGFLPK